jgi:SAM-dependent methyltransferase
VTRLQDRETLAFYSSQASAYANRGRSIDRPRLDAFLASLLPGAEVLELGCGAGDDSAHMLHRGFRACPTDCAPELAAEASKRLGIQVPVLRFEELDEVETVDGVWANACLLHVPRAGLPEVLERIHRALKPGGVFCASYKAGTAEGRDALGRFYNYPSADWLAATYGQRPWASVEIATERGGGYDKVEVDWLFVTATKTR